MAAAVAPRAVGLAAASPAADCLDSVAAAVAPLEVELAAPAVARFALAAAGAGSSPAAVVAAAAGDPGHPGPPAVAMERAAAREVA